MIPEDIQKKRTALRDYIGRLGSVAVAARIFRVIR